MCNFPVVPGMCIWQHAGLVVDLVPAHDLAAPALQVAPACAGTHATHMCTPHGGGCAQLRRRRRRDRALGNTVGIVAKSFSRRHDGLGTCFSLQAQSFRQSYKMLLHYVCEWMPPAHRHHHVAPATGLHAAPGVALTITTRRLSISSTQKFHEHLHVFSLQIDCCTMSHINSGKRDASARNVSSKRANWQMHPSVSAPGRNAQHQTIDNRPNNRQI